MKQIRAIRGMNDILPDETPTWQFLEQQVAQVLAAYGYREIRMPVVEQTNLFVRGIGEVTDVVEKEMYTFPDRNDESLTLRPEGTAGCVRAVCQHNLAITLQKLWYIGPMFRYERPQKGRQRQFHQIGVEVFGAASPDVDAELILLSARVWRSLGLDHLVHLQLSSIGDADSRNRYRAALVKYLSARRDQLDEDSQRRLETNPLRILDSKNPQTQLLLNEAPSLEGFLDEDSVAHFSRLKSLLDANDIEYTVNPRLVRGLDYYNRTVFEWVTEALGAQGTVCGGGRYDSLVEQLAGKPTPATGFAMGLERLVLLLEGLESPVIKPVKNDVYFVAVGDAAQERAFVLAELLRSECGQRVVQVHCGGGSFKSQMKKADKSGAQLAVILGEREVLDNTAAVKPLRSQEQADTQISVPQPELVARINSILL